MVNKRNVWVQDDGVGQACFIKLLCHVAPDEEEDSCVETNDKDSNHKLQRPQEILDQNLQNDVVVIDVLVLCQIWIIAHIFEVLLENQSNLVIEDFNVQNLICLYKSDTFEKEEIPGVRESKDVIERNQRN